MNNDHLTGLLLAASIHEIKNRFGVLYNQLDTLLPSVDSAQVHSVNRIKAEADFIGHELVRVLVAYKHLQEDAGILVDQHIVAEFLEDAVARHGYTQTANHVQISLECDEELTGFFDAQLVNIVVDTLIYNAIKAGAKQICLSAYEVPGWLYVECHDSGPGFPAGFPQHITTISSLSLETKSTGLGLYLAEQMLSAHVEGDRKGHLQLDTSNSLGGARVSIALPQ